MLVDSEHDLLSEDVFQYRWMSIDEMEADESIMEKNDDIIAFVKTKCK